MSGGVRAQLKISFNFVLNHSNSSRGFHKEEDELLCIRHTQRKQPKEDEHHNNGQESEIGITHTDVLHSPNSMQY